MDDNVTDPFTKVMLQQKHDGHVESLGIRYMGDWLQCKWEIVSVCSRSNQIGCYVSVQFMNANRINWFLYPNSVFLYILDILNCEIKSKRICTMHMEFIMEITNCEIQIAHYGSFFKFPSRCVDRTGHRRTP